MAKADSDKVLIRLWRLWLKLRLKVRVRAAAIALLRLLRLGA